jgi:extracellular elastinolytic metalloproteinase
VTKAGAGWKVISASSSLSSNQSLRGKARLADGQAWQKAAASVGRVRSLAQIARLRGKKASIGHGWKGLRVAASASDAFPADAPRPVAPMLLLRNFTFSPVKATHLRLVVRNSQCTGGPAYQGKQDADPFNATDCNAAGPAATRFVRVAEVQAFGGTSTAAG